MTYNKVVYDGHTLIDLTSDTITADKIMVGLTAHDSSGQSITGTAEIKVEGTTLVVPSWSISEV